MRILAITSHNLFPRSATDNRGIFFANFLRCLLPHVECVAVVSPQGYVPPVLSRWGPWAGRASPARARLFGMEVHRPTFLSLAAGRRLWFQGRSAAGAIGPLCRVLHRRLAFDLVMGQGFSGASHAALCVARDLGLPCVNWAIGSDVHTLPLESAENLRLLRHDVKHTDLVLTVCEDLRLRILRLCPGAANVRTFYWGTDVPGIQEQVADRAACRRLLALPEDRQYMLSAGWPVPHKGLIEFYEALRQLSREMPRLSAIWIGSGGGLSGLRQRARRDGLSERLVLPGYVPRREDVVRYMSAADVLAFPTYAEGMPNVVVEAMAAGLPVVASAVGGIPEVVVDGLTGRLVPARDAAALAAAVRATLEDPRASAEMAARARAFIRKYFDVRRNASAAMDLLRRVVAGTHLAGPLPFCAGLPPGHSPAQALREQMG